MPKANLFALMSTGELVELVVSRLGEAKATLEKSRMPRFLKKRGTADIDSALTAIQAEFAATIQAGREATPQFRTDLIAILTKRIPGTR